MLSLKQCSGPVDPKFKIHFVHLLRGPKIRGEGGQRSLDKSPNIVFLFFLSLPLFWRTGRLWLSLVVKPVYLELTSLYFSSPKTFPKTGKQ